MADADVGELIARLEKATGPDRDLDADVALAAGGFVEKHGMPGGGWVSRPAPHDAIVPAPSYTASIDAALTLKPQDCDWFVGSDDDVPSATIYPAHRNGDREWFRASTPAIALCIAALKTRQEKP